MNNLFYVICVAGVLIYIGFVFGGCIKYVILMMYEVKRMWQEDKVQIWRLMVNHVI